MLCPNCQFDCLPDYAFCPKCGNPLSAAPETPVPTTTEWIAERLQRLVGREYAARLLGTQGQVGWERRTVTIMFSDIKGSTAMAEDLDPEDAMEIMDGAFDLLIEPVYRYEGTLARLMGDAVLAFFGAPIAHEDDAERACRAALDIVEGAGKYAARLQQERGITGFNVRVGINTGLVVVGEVGSDLRVEYTAMGDVVNLASRLESAAEPGTVLVSEDTYRLIAPMFETAALGPIEVKGRSEPVPAYRVLAVKELPSKPRGIPGLESRLVGRQAEFAALRETLERLQAGAGGVVTIVGEAGIGKSRLVAEARKGASQLRWVQGRCMSYGMSIAYLPWLDMLRGLLGLAAEDSPAKVRTGIQEQIRSLSPGQFDEVYPYLAAVLSLPLETEVEARLTQLDGQRLKASTFRAVERLLTSAARHGPLVLVAEDLHWADPTSVELLESLLPLTEQVDLLLICVFRPEREHDAWRLREMAARDYGCRHTDLWLEPLSATESEMLVGNLLRLEDLPEKLKGQIQERAEGNPFYLEEVLRSLIDEGAITQEEGTGQWVATRDVADIAIPDTLQGVLLARIDRLQDETKRVLQMAAVIGRLFLCRVLVQLAHEERDLEGDLRMLQREGLVQELTRQPYLEYIFKHEMTREAAYNSLLKKDRRAFHQKVAQALERLYQDRLEELVGLLAHHWERAGDVERATACLLRAGDRARLVHAHHEAADFYQRALAFLKATGDNEQVARTLMRLGLTFDAALEFRRARQAYDEGFAFWRRAEETAAARWLPPASHAFRERGEDPLTLDPAFSSDDRSLGIVEQIFSGLVDLTYESGIVPDVAASWEVSRRGQRIVFHLRDDVYWSDGTPVTADDFAYSWRRVLDPATGSRNADLLYDIKGARAFNEGRVSAVDGLGVRALDDRTLTVELEAPTGYLLPLLSYGGLYPVPSHVVERAGSAWSEPENIVTNGPFQLESWQRGDSMRLVRNPRYHGRFGGNVQRVEMSTAILGDWRTSLRMYEADLLDIISLDGSPEETDRVRQRLGGDYITQPGVVARYMAFDVTRKPFDDMRVRLAFAHALDREVLADVTSAGYHQPASGGLVPPGMAGHSAGIALPHDPERGRQLLAEAGYRGGRGFPLVELLAPAGGRAQAPFLRDQARQHLGVEVQAQVLPWHEFVDRVRNGPPHLSLMGWAPDYPDPDSYLRVAVQRHTAWRDEQYFALVERARRSLNLTERMALYAQAELILVEQVPLLPLDYPRVHLLVKPWIRSNPRSATGAFFWKDVVIEPH